MGLARRAVVAPLAMATLLLIPSGPSRPRRGGDRLLHETETEYGYARVVQDRQGDRWLELNEAGAPLAAARRPRLPDWRLLGRGAGAAVGDRPAPAAPADRHPRDAAGTMARAYGHFFPRTWIDGVELDGALTDIGRRYFRLHPPRLRSITADARPFLRTTHERYDLIVVDAYRQPYIPFYLATREFFALGGLAPAPGRGGGGQRGQPAGLTRPRACPGRDDGRGLPPRAA